jgi:hypothetical protein
LSALHPEDAGVVPVVFDEVERPPGAPPPAEPPVLLPPTEGEGLEGLGVAPPAGGAGVDGGTPVPAPTPDPEEPDPEGGTP